MTRSMLARLCVAALVCLVCLSGCASSGPDGEGEKEEAADCSSAAPIGRFDPAADLLIANFDNKPDTDDLLAVAGLTTMLRDERFACVRSVATTGALGNKNPGNFIEADPLFDVAFGDAWADAHADRAGAEKFLTKHALATLRAGGDVWIMEAGQSDLTAAVAQRVSEAEPSIDLRTRVHLVQHSDVNEALATESALAYVQEHLDYIKIADGNVVGNGTPGFKTTSSAAWPALLADPESGSVWAEAQRLAVERNPTTGFPNEAIAAGGLDFSDVAEAAYIFGFDGLVDVDAFVAEFATRHAEK
jgi:hypothetical protein